MTSEYISKIEVWNDTKEVEKRRIGEYEDKRIIRMRMVVRRLKSSI